MFFGDDDTNPIAAIAMIILAPLAAMLLQAARFRAPREFEADASGAHLLHDGEPLARALEKIEAYTKQVPMNIDPAHAAAYIVNPLTGRKMQFANLFSTHPPTAERIGRLRARLYPSPGASAPAPSCAPSLPRWCSQPLSHPPSATWRAARAVGSSHREFAHVRREERGLSFNHPIPVAFLDDAEFVDKYNGDGKITKRDREDAAHYAGEFRALGLIEGGVDLISAYADLDAADVTGFYDDIDKRMVIRGTDLDDVEVRITIVHELGKHRSRISGSGSISSIAT